MSDYSVEWLALREPYDQRARNPKVLAAVAAALQHRSSIAVVDLACGTGSMLRAISPRLPAVQAWRLVDNDIGLLARASMGAVPTGTRITTMPVDLAHDFESILDEVTDLVTCSALLDLVSADWLDRFVVEVALRKLPAYVALTYDGRATLEPADPLDDAVVGAVNLHQRRDKGFGPALGPAAAGEAMARFKRLRYRLTRGRSDWVFGARDQKIQLEILAGWAGAACETGRLPLADTMEWLTRRRDLIAGGRSILRVGHIDFFATPIGNRRAERSQSNNTSSSSG